VFGFLPSLLNFHFLPFSLSHQTRRRRGEKIAYHLNIIYHYHGKAVLTFVLGLLFDIMPVTVNPAKKRRENRFFWPCLIYRYHSKTVLILMLGSLFNFASTTAPSEEEEREFFSLILFIVITARPCQLSAGLGNLALNWFCFFSVIKPSLGGENSS
jgi:hypothetical protein